MVREWLVAFIDDPRQSRPWWDRLFCRPAFRHVQAWGWDADAKVWVIYSVFTTSTMLDALPDGELADATIGGMVAVSSHVLRFRPPPEPERGLTLRIGFWCVPAVAHLLGIRSRALVPVQLYRELLARGATPAYEGFCGRLTVTAGNRSGHREAEQNRA